MLTECKAGEFDGKIYTLVAFVVLWHFFFSSSFVLRLNPQIFWSSIFVLTIVLAIYKRTPIQGEELKLYGFLFLGFIISFFSGDAWTSIVNGMYFFIYLSVAAMIARNVSIEKILQMISFFCIVHLVCIYIQVFIPDVYKNLILPLLPSYAHSDIIYQMTYNASYYGFTVQTSVAAMYMTIGAITLSVLAKYEQNKISKIICMVLVALFVTGVLFTTRRGSIFAICLVLAYIYFDTSGSKLSKVILLFLGVVFLLSFGIEKIPGMSGVLDKFARLSGNLMNGRQNIWTEALDNFWKYPIFGFGVGRAIDAGGGALVDNAYITVLVERGFVGTAVYFIPIVSLFFVSYRRKKRCRGNNFAIDYSFYVQMLFIIMSFMENYYGQALTMFLYYLAVLCEDFMFWREIDEDT